MFDLFSEVSWTAEKEQDTATIKAFCWSKVREEVCHHRLTPNDAGHIGNDPTNTILETVGGVYGPVKEERVS